MNKIEERPREALLGRVPERSLERRIYAREVAVDGSETEQTGRQIEKLFQPENAVRRGAHGH
jgi:hypothetical protein